MHPLCSFSIRRLVVRIFLLVTGLCLILLSWLKILRVSGRKAEMKALVLVGEILGDMRCLMSWMILEVTRVMIELYVERKVSSCIPQQGTVVVTVKL